MLDGPKTESEQTPKPGVAPQKSGALWVAAGIFLSRIAGFIRQRAFAHYFGNSDLADAFAAAYKIPNFLQNLFGEGVLSASFIPVYARLLADKSPEAQKKAGEVAGAVLGLLCLVTSLMVLAGVLLTPFAIDLIAPGFTGAKRDLTILLVQILFPGTGMLVISAWCLGILNSHRKFFLSYAAPVIWNLTQVATLYIFGRIWVGEPLVVALAWGLVAGSALQVLVQIPTALRLLPDFLPSLNYEISGVRTIIRNFVPVLVSRGVVQLSAYVDTMIASLLPSGAVSSLSFAQMVYLLPVSLFGMSVSAAELPAMSQVQGGESDIAEQLKKKVTNAAARISFLVIPSGVAFFFLGHWIVGLLFESGQFNTHNTVEVWRVLAGSSVGLLAATLGRLYSSCFYALGDTRTPFRFALVRVALTIGTGFLMGLYLPGWLGLDRSWGAAGLTASAGLSGWVEFSLLRRALGRRLGRLPSEGWLYFKLYGAALVAAGAAHLLVAAWVGQLVASPLFLVRIFGLSLFGVIYFGLTLAFKIESAQNILQNILKSLRRRIS